MGKRNFKFKDLKTKSSSQPLIMGILNVTPDSFSDGGKYFDCSAAVERGLEMLREGAAIIDLGGESSRPGAETLSPEEEQDRILPVISGLRKQAPDCVISIDTRKSIVAENALKQGADIINDISGLQYSPEMARVAAEYSAGLIIMHMRGTPETMQCPENLEYDDIIAEVYSFLLKAAEKAQRAGVEKDNIILDPGIGFSKNVRQNIHLAANINQFSRNGYMVLAGASRKSFIAKTLGSDEMQARIWGTAGTTAWFALCNVDIIRVHDVMESIFMLKMFNECRKTAG